MEMERRAWELKRNAERPAGALRAAFPVFSRRGAHRMPWEVLAVKCLVSELRYKEVIDVADGSRYGFLGDAEVDLDSGAVTRLIVPGRPRLLGLLGREEALAFPWESVRRFGADTILVERMPPLRVRR